MYFMIMKPNEIMQICDYQSHKRKPLIAVAFKRCGYFPYNFPGKMSFAKHESIISLQPDLKFCCCSKIQ
jgi:hypothetical protein